MLPLRESVPREYEDARLQPYAATPGMTIIIIKPATVFTPLPEVLKNYLPS
jgi:hypothetical protein